VSASQHKSRTENPVTDGVDLVVIGYPDETTAEKAYEVVMQLSHDLIMQVAGSRHAADPFRVAPVT
jgi:hypothetical protein